MKLDITKQKEKAIAIMKRMDIYAPYITGLQIKEKQQCQQEATLR